MPAQQLVMEDLLCTECSVALNEDTRSRDHLQVCDNCLDDNIGCCEFCGFDYVVNADLLHRARDFGAEPRYTMAFIDHEYICTGCVSTCNDCGSQYAYESDAFECCPEPASELHYYSFRPAMRFWSTHHSGVPTYKWQAKPGELYMGIEIEVEKAADYVAEMVDQDVNEDWNNPNFYYWKSDGSLGGEGAEMVTMPATLEAHRVRFPFEHLDWLHQQGARAWAYPSCGMHIHVSRSAFTAPHMWKFIKFQLANSDTLAQIAGRNSQQWASWTNDTMQDARRNAKKYVKPDGWDRDDFVNRYSAINVLNQNTVELRYFRSNISRHGIMRNLELVAGMWDYTADLSVRDLLVHGWSFDRFVDYLREYPAAYGTIVQYIEREGIA